jgi:hypothetical protein
VTTLRAGLRADLRAILAGGGAGFAVLGLGGRLTMAALPILTGSRPRFTWGGSIEVVLLGSIYGACGGVALALLRRTRWHAVPGAQLWFGLLMFGAAWATSAVGRSTATSAPVAAPIVGGIAALIFVAYGVLATALAKWWRAIIDTPGR